MPKKQKNLKNNKLKEDTGLTKVTTIIIISAIVVAVIAVVIAVILIILKSGILEDKNGNTLNTITQDTNNKINVGGRWYNSMEEYLASDVTANKEPPEVYEYSFNVGYKNGQVTRRYSSIHCGD